MYDKVNRTSFAYDRINGEKCSGTVNIICDKAEIIGQLTRREVDEGDGSIADVTAFYIGWGNTEYGKVGMTTDEFMTLCRGECCSPAVCPSPYPEPFTLPDAQQGSPYFATLQLLGDGEFSILEQELPDGLSIAVDAVTGEVTIDGTPTEFGQGLEVKFKAANCGNPIGEEDGQSYIINIAQLLEFVARTPANSNEWYDVAFGAGKFVAIAQSGTGNRVMTSPDGITWTIRASASDDLWSSICWSQTLGLFVAVAVTGIMTSPDGITWTSRTEPEVGQWRQVIWVDALGLFVAVGTLGSNRVMTSPDGINWTSRVAAALNQWYGVEYSPDLGLLVAVAITGSGNRVMTSPDGINWTIRASAFDLAWRKVAWAAELGLFVAVSTTSTGFAQNIMTSPDGINWTLVNGLNGNLWADIIYAGGIFVACATGGAGAKIMKSYDGLAWTAVAAPDQAYSGLAYAFNRFVAVGNGAVATAEWQNLLS